MAVEVSGMPGESTALISIEKFFREHEDLHKKIKKHRSLIPISQQTVEARNEQKTSNISPNRGRRRGGIATNTINKAGNIVDDEANNTFLLPRSPTTFVDYTYDTNKGQPFIPKLTRKETEEYLHRILDNTVNITKVLEEQYLELLSRGWNKIVM